MTDQLHLISNDATTDDDSLTSNSEHEKTNVRKDLRNIIFLMFLYFLQGIPLGLSYSLPYILGARNVSYADQGTFSFTHWPYSMKLLWAPFVDSIYVKRFGRRKSWLVPMQLIIGLFMIFYADYVHEILEVDRGQPILSKGKLQT